MSFNEKLQNLRKANKMSQEQLADMLDVTRQSVSKWESAQTYPEMDKLLAMCKIFKCSLDDLTNDEITDIKVIDKKRNNISNFIDSVLDLIKRTYDMFRTMKAKNIVQCLITMFIVGCILLLFRLPFQGLESAFYSIVYNIGNETITSFVSGIFNLLLDICYYVLYVLIFVYIFKIGYLDRYEIANTETSKETTTLEEKENKKSKVVRNETNHSYPIFNTLGIIAMFFIKVMVCFFAIPFVISLFMLCASLLMAIILLFKGVFYFGILFGIVFAILLNILIVELIINFLFNRQNNPKRLLITFLISIVGLGLSFGLLMFDIANTTYIDSAPDVKKDTVTKEVTMNENMYFDYYYDVEYVVDNNLNDKVKVEVTYYKDYSKVIFNIDETGFILTNESPEKIVGKDYVDLIVENLADKTIYNYNELFSLKIKVTTSEQNIAQIKNNYIQHEQEIEENSFQEQRNYYEEQIQEYENRLNDLELQNEELRSQNEDYKYQIEDYKENIQALLDK